MSWRVGSVVATRKESATARTLAVALPDWPGHDAGQHVDVRLTAPDGYTAVRSYSIASAPGRDRIELTVEAFPDGEVSPYLTNVIVDGNPLEVRGPIGGWFVWRPQQTEPVQLVAGGSGLVPLMSMIRARAAAGSTARFRLLYSVREPDALLYAEELRGVAAANDGVAVTYAYTRAVPPGWPQAPGRVDAALVASATWAARDAPMCYVCGPTAFVETVADLLAKNGHDPSRIKTERFGPTGGTP